MHKIIFDADNTLFDFDQAEENALVNSLQHFNLPAPDGLIEFYRSINVALWQQLDAKQITIKQLKQKRAEQLFEFIGHSADVLDFSLHYLDELGKQPILLPGVEQTLDDLSAHCEMAIITNGLAHVQNRRFELCSIRHHFDQLVIAEEVGCSKPDAEIFAYTCDLMGWNNPSQVLMVGDNYRCDIQGAGDFGMKTCWFNLRNVAHNHTDHHYEIKQFNELLAVIEK